MGRLFLCILPTMKKIACLFALLSCAGCISMDIGSQLVNNEDFSQFKTYAWLRRTKDFRHADPNIDNDNIESKIIQYTNLELAARGYTVDTLEPDILLDYNIVTQNKVSQYQQPIYSTVYRPYYYNPYNPGFNPYVGPTTYISGYRTVNVPYEDGTVTIYVLDRRSNQLIWKGWAEGSVDDVESFQWELPKDIDAIFKKYPIKEQKDK